MKPKPALGEAPAIRECVGQWKKPAARRCSMNSPNRFCFLNEVGELELSSDWQSKAHAKLWLYNLHYFDDLNAEGAATRSMWHQALISRWISENLPGIGIGWEPYPLSLRIVNWVKWALAGNELGLQARHSLAVQVRFLAQRLEWHLLGNHLFANAKALVFAGCYFAGKEAQGWLGLGMRILKRELPEQILADGGQFERSTMYHALAYEDLLDLYNLSKAYPKTLELWQDVVGSWPELIRRMGNWLSALSHPDGEIAFFNDAAIGVAPPPDMLFDYAVRLGCSAGVSVKGVTQLAESGYIRVELGAAVLLFDAAPVGPDYLPGHAHADTLSCELSIDGCRILVNSGISCYGDSEARLRQRATMAHNTVEINGEDSSEVWGGFRVARRAYPIDLFIRDDGDGVLVRCTHDGYRRLAGRPTHTRESFLSDSGLRITDKISGRFNFAKARFYLHPDVIVETSESIRLPSGRIVRFSPSGGVAKVIDTWWHPEFGVNVKNVCIEVEFVDRNASLDFYWG